MLLHLPSGCWDFPSLVMADGKIVQGQQEWTPAKLPSQQALLDTCCLCVDLVPCYLGLSIVLAGSADPPSTLVMDLKPGIIVFPDRLCVSLIPQQPLGVIHSVTFDLLSINSWQVLAGSPGPRV